jgi:hypothetical protein
MITADAMFHGPCPEKSMSKTSRAVRLALLLSLTCTAGGAFAAAQRTFVASGGSDSNSCTLGAPCRSFNAAIAQTLPGGEVIVLDSAGYGPAVITQSVSIIAPAGVYAGVSVFTGAGIVVSGAANVTLQGLTINSLGGTIGIDYQSGGKLHVDGTVVTGFTGAASSAGVRAALAGSGILVIRNSTFRDNDAGVRGSSAAGTLTVDIDRSAFERNAYGIALTDGTAGVIRNSTVIDGGVGVGAEPTTAARSSRIEVHRSVVAGNNSGVVSGANAGAPALINLVSSLVSGNATGVVAIANPVYASGNTITRNAIGLSFPSGGTGQTGQDNAVVGNAAGAAFTSVVPRL